MRQSMIARALLLLAAVLVAGGAHAAPCRTGGPYDKWLADFEREAMAQGVSQRTIAAAAPFLTYDQRIVNIDHGQRVSPRLFWNFPTAWRRATGFSPALRKSKLTPKCSRGSTGNTACRRR